ncbi:MAG: leucine-rich repeat protein [Clostridiaceae bacterium]|nr:leucine-rich repeat protein [Clostridiaceae bacterium]
MKKALSILLSLILVLAALPFTAVESFATDYYTSPDGEWMYYLNENDEAIIYSGSTSSSAYLGSDTDIVVPSYIDRYPVVSLGQYTFSGNTNLQSIVLPNTLTTISNHVFRNCTNLTSVTFGNSVGMLGPNAFEGCTALTEMNLPDSVQTIGSYAFSGCTNLEKIYIPTGLTSIGGYAFNNCNKVVTYVKDLAAWCAIDFNNGGGYYSNPMERAHTLYIYDSSENDYILAENIVIPNGVTGISAGAFDGCQTMKSIVLPEGLTTINQYAFRSCSNLESITIPSTLTSISSRDTFYGCNKLNAVHISDIAAWCNITFDSSGANPLSYAKNLYIGDTLATDITIPSTVTTVKNNAFYYCTSLVNVTLASGVTTVNQAAFYNCLNLESITVSNTVTTINSNAFYNCSKLNAVYITDLEAWCDITFTNADANPLYKAHNLYINNVLSTVTVPTAISQIKQYSFAGLGNDVIIPGNVTTIGSYAFYGGTLESATLQEGVRTIKAHAFNGCTSMTSVYFPSTITVTENYAFGSCSKLSTYITDMEAWCNVQFGDSGGYYANPLETGHNLYLNGNLVTDLVIPNTITEIKYCAFMGASCIKSVTIPESVTTVGRLAFYDCTNLESITIPSTLTSIHNDRVFSYCNNLKEVHISDLAAWCNISFPNNSSNPLYYAKNLYLGNNKITDMVIPNTVTEIKPFTFYNCSGLTSLTIPDNVTAISNEAFYGCSGLQSVTVGNSLASIGNNAFYNCSGLNAVYITDLEHWCDIQFSNQASNPLYSGHNLYVNNVLSDITIPSTVTQLKQYVFTGLANNVTIPGNVNEIGPYAFADGKLSAAVLQEGVSIIRANAFSNCSSMTSITIPATLTTTENYAFSSCNNLGTYITDLEAWCNIQFGNGGGYYANPLETGHNLYLNNELVTDLVIPDTVTELKYCSFMGCSMQSVRLPNGLKSIGNLAFYNCTSLKSIIIPKTVTTIGNDRVFAYCNALTDYYCFKDTRGDTYWTNNSTKYYMGDMDSDKAFDFGDISAILSASVGSLENMTEVQQTVADYDLDGVVDGFDAAEVDRYAYSVGITKGDVNQDGEIELTDYAMIKAYISGVAVDSNTPANLLSTDYLETRYDTLKAQYPEGTIITSQYYCADVDSDKAVDAFDLFYIDKLINKASMPPTYIYSDGFESYAVDTTVSSGATPFTVQYDGTGNGNQKVITAQQADGSDGNVLQLQGSSGWASEIRYGFTPDERQYLVFEADVKPVAGTSPGDVLFASNQAGGGWTHSVCRFGLGNNGFHYGTEDATTAINTDLTYTNGNWYHLKMVLDTSDYKFYVSVDGNVLNPEGYQAVSATPEWLALGAGNAGQNTMYFDNISIYSVDSAACVTD